MNDIVFFNNFRFNEFRYSEIFHCDNSMGVDFHYIGYIKHGRGRIVCGGEKMEIAAGEMFYIPKGCRYHSCWIPEETVCFDSIGFLYFPSEAPGGYKLQKIPCDDALWNAFAPLTMHKKVSVESVAALFCVLDLLSKRLEFSPADAETVVIEKMLQAMQKDPSLTISEYARLCDVSESLLYQYVKKRTKKTPNHFRRVALCEKAIELLVATNYTVEEICDRLGVSSAAYFRKILYDIHKKTPSQIRKEGRTM